MPIDQDDGDIDANHTVAMACRVVSLTKATIIIHEFIIIH